MLLVKPILLFSAFIRAKLIYYLIKLLLICVPYEWGAQIVNNELHEKKMNDPNSNIFQLRLGFVF